MNKIIILVLILGNVVFTGCSLKSEDTESSKDAVQESNGDNDGDLMSNVEETLLGRNPNLADLPNLKVRFIQNYRVEINYKNKDEEESKVKVFDTSVDSDNPDFKYRVGDIFIRDYSFRASANVGKFASHSWGEIEERDLSWVSYPNVDPKFFHSKAFDTREIFNEEKFDIDDIKIELENSVKLLANRGYTQIKNLELNFYYYNYETETYELLKTEKIERTFFSGTNELFKVEIDGVPRKILEENYFKRGEFIVTEISDYEIPELKTTYKRLMASVREKTVPVVYNTPLESNIFYVASGNNGKSFANILEIVFSKNYEVENNQLTRIGQFENNLGDFTYLKEVAEKDKKGKWFVLTNGHGIHFLDKIFMKKDYLSLSYMTGKELARQSSEKIYSYSGAVTGGQSFRVIPLGNISPNSKVELQFLPLREFGTYLEQTEENVSWKTHSVGKNKIKWGLYCLWEINRLVDYNQMVNPHNSLVGPLERIVLMVNEEEYSLATLLEEKKISVSWISRGWDIRKSVHIIINNISEVQDITNFEENTLSLKLYSDASYVSNGIKLIAVDRFWEGQCSARTYEKAINKGLPISSKSIHLEDFNAYYPYMKIAGKETVKFQDDLYIYKQLEINVSSLIENYHN